MMAQEREEILLHLTAIQARSLRDKNMEIQELRTRLAWMDSRIGKLEEYIIVGVRQNVSSTDRATD